METLTPVRVQSSRLEAAFAAVRELDIAPAAEPARRTALEVATLVRGLEADEDVVLAALLQPLIEAKLIEREAAAARFGAEAARLARELIPLGQFGLPADWTPEQPLEPAQAEALRKMLLALIGDVRLVVVRLAAQVWRLRSAKTAALEVKRKLAIETREVYAPLANRLGVWQVKWELEDLAFRYLEPEEYRHIATALKARRADRERYIEELKRTLQEALVQAGVAATVQGRPKHIYSIWRKMRTKQLDFDQLMDIRAIRVLVDTVGECYAALGVVHSLWSFIPGEFDDYIATPKGNLYRSIHTAVIGPEALPVEIQIRTHEMHANSEHGVAAHWRYKEGGRSEKAYERKINELRALLAPIEGADTPGAAAPRDFLDRMRIDLFRDRIYVLSPKGEVVDVPVGGTPLDFAYQVHTDLGHRTRGAKVNGRMVGLDYPLKNGETVEIITAKAAQPSRDWLSPQSGYLASPRNRNKVRAWFRKLDATRNESAGEELLQREMQRLGVQQLPMPELLAELRLERTQTLHEALGLGEVSVAQLLGALQRVLHAREAPEGRDGRPGQPVPAGARGPGAGPGAASARPPLPAPAAPSQIEVQGIGDLLSTFARCCRPVPPEPIAGFITVGRGVSIHASACRNLARLAARSPARVLAVDWGDRPGALFPVDIEVRAFDRRGLVRDVSAALADEKISIEAMHTITDPKDHMAQLEIRISIEGLPQLSRVLARIGQVPNVIGARRRK